MKSFGFAFDRKVGRWNRLFGITPSRACVQIDGDTLTARFGPWSLTTTLDNVAAVTTTGPYRPWRVAGPARMSLADRGLTFATNSELGLCIAFVRPVPGADPLHLLRHPSLTVTVADPPALGLALTGDDGSIIHADLTHGSFSGTVRAMARWVSRRRSVRIDPVVDVADMELPTEVARSEAQDIASGVGALFHRTYRVRIAESALTAQEIVHAIREDPNVIADMRLGPFVKTAGEQGAMSVGDRFTVETAGPWSGPVEVCNIGPERFRLVTRQGHMEAGAIEMHAHIEEPLTVFEIESWARSGDRAFDLLYDKVGIAKTIQSEMWVNACEAVVLLSRGQQTGPVEITEERLADPDSNLSHEVL